MRSAVAEIRSFGAYLYRMCKNTAIDYCRHRNINIPLSEEYDDNVATVDENFFAKEIEAQIASLVDKMPKKGKKVYLVGAGTAGFAAGQTAYFLRNIANIDAQEVKSYEFKSYLPIVKKGDIVIAFYNEILKEGCLIECH